jgi:hypothetical protein
VIPVIAEEYAAAIGPEFDPSGEDGLQALLDDPHFQAAFVDALSAGRWGVAREADRLALIVDHMDRAARELESSLVCD